jgi:hypothetical protein
MGKTYLTVKAVEMIANAFRNPKARKPATKANLRTTRRRGAAT